MGLVASSLLWLLHDQCSGAVGTCIALLSVLSVLSGTVYGWPWLGQSTGVTRSVGRLQVQATKDSRLLFQIVRCMLLASWGERVLTMWPWGTAILQSPQV